MHKLWLENQPCLFLGSHYFFHESQCLFVPMCTLNMLETLKLHLHEDQRELLTEVP